MKLIDLLNRAVRPKLNEKFGNLLVEVPEFDDESDETDVSLAQSEFDSLSGLSLILEYADSKGRRSQRVVTCKQLSVQAEVQYLKAFCHNRQSIRTFRLDRILDVFDAQSGASLGPAHGFFAQFAPDKVSTLGLSWGLSVANRADLIALLNALVFIARCDREFHPAEQAALETALTSFWIRLEIAGDPDFSAILDYAARLSPDGETFWLAMQRIAGNSRLSTIVKQQLKAIIEADGIVRQEEAFWSLEIEQFLSQN